MAKLNEVAEFVDEILRLDLVFPVRGYDGKDNGPANEQAQVLGNRTLYIKENLSNLKDILTTLGQREYVASVNNKTGNITLTYSDVGAAKVDHKHPAGQITVTASAQFASNAEKLTWDNKQDAIVSGTTLKTLLGNSLLGSGNIIIKSEDVTTTTELQFASQKEKSTWSGKQIKLESGKNISTLHNKSLLTGENIVLTPTNVNAEPSGATDEAIINHLDESDPHPQYLNESRADKLYVKKTSANKPNGYLQLNDEGKIPDDIAELFEVRYIIVTDESERLKITGSNNITICLQTNENIIYYLDAGTDPAVEDNWHNGRSANSSDVISVFGREGDVTAQEGDYNANQITETSSRVFAKQEEKKSWTNKQSVLTSGTDIKTLNNTALLGEGDIQITPATIKASSRIHIHSADQITQTNERQFVSSTEKEKWNNTQEKLVNGGNIKTVNSDDILGMGDFEITPKSVGGVDSAHTHTPNEIITDDDEGFASKTDIDVWDDKQDKLVSGIDFATVFKQTLLSGKDITLDDVDDLASVIFNLLIPGKGLKITFNSETNTVDFALVTDNSIIIGDVTATAETAYKFPLNVKGSINFVAYALLLSHQDINEKTTVTFNASYINRIISKTEGMAIINDIGYINTKTIMEFKKAGTDYYISDNLDLKDLISINIVGDDSPNGIVPSIPNNTNSAGYYTAIGGPERARAYGPQNAFGAKPDLSTKLTATQIFQSAKSFNASSSGDVWVGVICPKVTPINSYCLPNFVTTMDNYSSFPTSWELQGTSRVSQRDWVTIDKRTNIEFTPKTENLFYLDKPAEYSIYRIVVLAVTNPTAAYVRICQLQIFYDAKMLIKDNEGTTYRVTSNKLYPQSGISSVYGHKSYGFNIANIQAEEFTKGSYYLTSARPRNAYIYYRRQNQIVVNTRVTDDNAKTNWEYLSGASATYTKLNGENIKLSVSPDGGVWYTLNSNNEWVKYNIQLSSNTTSANQVLSSGIPIANLSKITSDMWKSLMGLADGPVTLGLSFAAVSDTTENNQLIPDSINFTFESVDSWERKYVPVTLDDNEIIFTPKEDGTYKFCYQFK